ncbi:transposase [Nocardia salmonicida]|uniref:transposase n=1 Tax=Nocardia salmonicida TaxID=53431 RepID=UPI003415EFC6
MVDDQLWAVIEPLVPVKAAGTPGPARMNDRSVLQGILFVLITGIGWEDLPKSIWNARSISAGVGGTGFRVRHDLLAQVTRLAGRRSVRGYAHHDARPLSPRGIDRFRPCHPRQLARAGQKIGSADTSPSPVDRRKIGAKHHIVTCGNGNPLAIVQSAANVNDHLVLPELLDRVRPLRGRPGRPREKITTLIADKDYDYPRAYDELERRAITGYNPRRGTRDKVTAGRWIVEQTLALLHQYRRLSVRWEHRTDVRQGFLDLAAGLICWRRLSNRT